LEGRDLLSGIVIITPTASSMPEGNQASGFIQLSGQVTGNVTVGWQSSPGSASAGSDYTHASGSVQLSQSGSFAYVNVSTLTDSTYDPNETFSIQITSVTGDATLGTPSSAHNRLGRRQPADGSGRLAYSRLALAAAHVSADRGHLHGSGDRRR
jgi:hypothetical protein